MSLQAPASPARHGLQIVRQVVQALLLCMVVAQGAVASTVVIDFEDQAAGGFTNNFTTQGFTFSPSCHYDIEAGYNGPGGWTPAPYGHWIGFDYSGCNSNPGSIGFNNNYLGPPGISTGGRLHVAAQGGQHFDLASFVFATIAGDSFGIDVFSSKGGSASFSYVGGNWVQYNFAGALWQDLEWLVFSGRYIGAPAGFDNLTLNLVPLPSTAALAALALLLMPTVARRHARRQRPATHSPPTSRQAQP